MQNKIIQEVKLKKLKVWMLLLIIINLSCVDSQKNSQHTSKLSYDQAVEMLKEYVYGEKIFASNEEVRFLYQPSNIFWKLRYGEYLGEIEEICNLTGRDYYVFYLNLLPPGARCGDGRDDIVFIDKNEKQVLGLFTTTKDFKKNLNKISCKTDQDIFNKRSDYDQSIDITKQYLVDIGYCEREEEVCLLYDPSNGEWERHISWKPESLEVCGLLGKVYDAIYCGVLDPSKEFGIVFVDKTDKRVIGILYDHDNRYEENISDKK